MLKIFSTICRLHFQRTDSRRSPYLLHLLLTVLMVPGAASAAGPNAFGQETSATPANNARTLAPGDIVRQSMKGGDVHAFRLALEPRQYVHVVVEQEGIDVVEKLSDPNGTLLVKVDNPNSNLGPEAVSTVAQLAGSYTIEISADKAERAGTYELRVEGPREASSADKSRVTAELLFMNGQNLRSQGTADSSLHAIEQYKKALDIWRELGDAQQEGYTLCNIGRAYKLMGSDKLRESLDAFSEAQAALKAAQDVPGQAFVLNETGATHRDLGNPLDALEPYNLALELRRGLNDLRGQAQLLNNIGLIYYRTGSQQRAIKSYDQALALWQVVGDSFMEANTINNVALAHRELGELAEAFQKLQQVLKFCQENKERSFEANVLNNVGLIYDSWADSQSALDSYATALEIFRGLQDSRGEALTMENIGMVYAELDDAPRALQYFQDALKIRQRLREPKWLGVVLHHMGAAQALEGRHQEALNTLNSALGFSRESSDKQFEAYSLVEIGMLYIAQEDPAKALQFYQEALKIQQEDARGRAITLDKIGQAYSLISQSEKARESYQEALSLWSSVGDRQGEALSLYGLARVARDQNELGEARDRIRKAIEKVEDLRSKMTSHQLRTTYFAARQDYYELAIDIQMRLYDLAHSRADMEAALSFAERARARTLLDLLTEARAKVSVTSSPALAARFNQLEQEISALDQKIPALRSQKRAEDAAAVEEHLNRLIREHDDLGGKIRIADPSYAQLRRPQPLEARRIQALLDDDTVLLEYALGEKRSYLWAVTRTEVIAYALPGRAEIEQASEDLRESLTAYEPPRAGEGNLQYIARRRKATADYPQRALALSTMVLGPVSSNIANKRLVIVADGALQYVPFGVLPAPVGDRGTGQSNKLALDPLILRHEVVYQPSASALAVLREETHQEPPGSVAVVADPVFNPSDERVRFASKQLNAIAAPPTQAKELSRPLRDAGDSGDSEYKLERLRYSGQEADAIVAAAPYGTWMKAVDFKASRATALSPELKQFKIVHLATHGILNGKHPELSGMVFSLVNQRGQPEDGFLPLADIYNLDLPVDLVVLSACRTAVGKQVKGEGLIGLTRGFMHAGAPRVVASLWSVDDQATAELMKRFYGYMLKKNMPAAAALRQAQLDIMTQREEWKAPYYWAGFVLQGEWK